jgi:uncharacterized protein DUF5335
MSEITIPPTLWQDFLQTFSEHHAGRPVQIETHDNETGENVISQVAALHLIELDVEDEKNPRINVIVLYDTKEIKHILFRPSHLALHISEQDGNDSLRIRSLNTGTTIQLRGAKKVDMKGLLKTLNALDVGRHEAA